jgi:uncharacterized protein (DUF433 family)
LLDIAEIQLMDELVHNRISVNPQICHGQPVIAGTRIPVSQILSAMGSGESVEALLKNYPSLTAHDIKAAIAFGGELAKFEEIPETATR